MLEASSARPAVKRTYGARKISAASTSGSSVLTSLPSSSSSSSSASASSSASHKRARRDAAVSISSDGVDVSLTYSTTSTSSSSSSDPPTPPPPSKHNVNTSKSTTALLPARKRLLQQQESITTSKGKAREVIKPKKMKLEQMHLAFSTAPLSVTCKKCAMAYMRGSVDDEELHKRYCKRAASGVEWPASLAQSETSRVVQDGILLGKGKERLEASIWMVEGSSSGAVSKKLAEISETVDQSLSAASLSTEQVNASKYFLLLAKPANSLSKSRKVIGCAIVERIEEAHRVVAKRLDRYDEPDLLRFGEDDGAIFCSPIPTPALLGIHRIWSSPSHRRQGIAALLLDAIAEHAIYGRNIPSDDRKDTIAFSQPSDAGRQLFAAWTGTKEFLVFVD